MPLETRHARKQPVLKDSNDVSSRPARCQISATPDASSIGCRGDPWKAKLSLTALATVGGSGREKRVVINLRHHHRPLPRGTGAAKASHRAAFT